MRLSSETPRSPYLLFQLQQVGWQRSEAPWRDSHSLCLPAYAVLAAYFGDLQASIGFLEDRHDLALGESAFLH